MFDLNPWSIVAVCLLVAMLAALVVFRTIRPSWPALAAVFVRPRSRPRLPIFAALFGVGLVLAACASGGGNVVPTPQTPAQGVFLAEGVLTAAMNAGAVYTNLPACVAGGPTECANPTIVADMRVAGQAATAAILTAQATISDPTSSAAAQQSALADALAAIADLTAITGGLPTTPPATSMAIAARLKAIGH